MFAGLTNGNGPIAHGVYAVTAGDVTATQSVIATGLTSVDNFLIHVIRSNKYATVDAGVTVSGGSITVKSGSTYTLTASDSIHWLAIGK